MIQTQTNNILYRSSVSPARRNSLLLIYQEYISLVKYLDKLNEQVSSSKLAQIGAKKIYGTEKSPWQVSLAVEKDQLDYKNFINNQAIDSDNHNCYVSLNLTTPSNLKTGKSIISAPEDYEINQQENNLPHRIERYTTAAKKDEILADVKFIIEGKYVIKYEGEGSSSALHEMLNDEGFKNKLNCILDCLTRYPENADELPQKKDKEIKTEVMVSAIVSPIENTILDMLSLMADETHKIIKSILGKRKGNRFLAQAEKEGLINSASTLQDYLNIRHLIHHQWDTLDNIGKFNENELLKKEGVRQQYLNSYCSLCNKSFNERIKAYTKAAKEFITLIQILNPQLFIQKENENIETFLQRIVKEYQQLSEQQIYVQTNKETSANKKYLVKKLKEVYPTKKIIDITGTECSFDELETLLRNCTKRRLFSELYQTIEYKAGLYCLLAGKNYTTNYVWDYMRRKHFLSPEDVDKWVEYKKLRNELSHQYLNEEINKKMYNIFPEFIENTMQLEKKIDASMPIVVLIENDIYEARHKNGKIVRIDFGQKKVLSVNNEVQYQPHNNTPSAHRLKLHTEEYDNKTSITTTDTQVISCELKNGMGINFDQKKLEYSDGTKICINNDRIYIIAKHEKIITNNNFEVKKYIVGNREINLHRNENCNFNQTHQITIKNHKITGEQWVKTDGTRLNIRYSADKGKALLELPDKTLIVFENNRIRVYHDNIELTYSTRREFAKTYNTRKCNVSLIKSNTNEL